MEKEGIISAFQEPPTDTETSLSSWPMECVSAKEAPSLLHVLLCKLPHHTLADMPCPVCPFCSWSLVLPRAALCGHGGWHHSDWPHAHLIIHSHKSCHFLAGLSTAWGFPRSGPLPSPMLYDTLLCCRTWLLFNSAINVLLITMWSTTRNPSMMNINSWKDDKNFRAKHWNSLIWGDHLKGLLD